MSIGGRVRGGGVRFEFAAALHWERREDRANVVVEREFVRGSCRVSG